MRGTTLAQRKKALNSANPRRTAIAQTRRDLKSGGLTLADVCRLRPEELRKFTLAEITTRLPQFGRSRQERLGVMAARQGVNLLVTLERASEQTCTWVVAAVGRLTKKSDGEIADLASGDEVETLRGRVEKLTAERDSFERRYKALAEEVAGEQTTLAVGDAADKLRQVVSAVREHKRTVTTPSVAGEKWANADETLWESLDAIGGMPLRRAA